jgi:uncharacterized membrane protein YkvA (DUF1232 family)
MMANTDFSSQYSDSGFWEKVKGYAKVAGKGVLEPALKMYYAAMDSDTPVWARTTIFGALGYFISPIDVIPDLMPAVGYTDDIGVLIAAAAAVAAHIKPQHLEQARTTLKQWFGE